MLTTYPADTKRESRQPHRQSGFLRNLQISKSDFICRTTPYGTHAATPLSRILAAGLGKAACRLKVGEEVMVQSDRYTAKELCVNASLT